MFWPRQHSGEDRSTFLNRIKARWELRVVQWNQHIHTRDNHRDNRSEFLVFPPPVPIMLWLQRWLREREREMILMFCVCQVVGIIIWLVVEPPGTMVRYMYNQGTHPRYSPVQCNKHNNIIHWLYWPTTSVLWRHAGSPPTLSSPPSSTTWSSSSSARSTLSRPGRFHQTSMRQNTLGLPCTPPA